MTLTADPRPRCTTPRCPNMGSALSGKGQCLTCQAREYVPLAQR